MTDHSLAALQKGIIAHLTANIDIIAAFFPAAPRIYYRVPKTTQAIFPYIKIGVMEQKIDDFGCGKHYVIRVTNHVFHTETDVQSPKNLAEILRDCLLDETMTVAPFTLEDTQFNTLRSLTDPDGLTEHVVIEHTFTLSNP